MPRNLENKAFVINQLRAIAGSKKVPPSLRVKCLDRIAVLEKFYEVALTEYYGPSAGRGVPEAEKELDNKIESMLRQLGGENAS